MPYPIKQSGLIGPGQTFSVVFRPLKPGLVKVIVQGFETPLAPPLPVGQALLSLSLDVLKPGGKTAALHTSGQKLASAGALTLWRDATASAADLKGDWTARVTNGGEIPVFCNLTARFPLMAGNLGKVDHVVVLMLENRSFDHMLGYLHLNNARPDVNGLTGKETNKDLAGNPFPVHHLVSTCFRVDPGHEWDDVHEQLGRYLPSTPPPPAGAKGNFVTNFARVLERQGPQNDTDSVHDTALVESGASHFLRFRPGQPGPISVSCTSTADLTHVKTETGLLGKLILRRPGSTTPQSVSVPIGSTALGHSFTATAADLAVPGDWTCEVLNETLEDLTLTSNILFLLAPVTEGEIMGYYQASDLPVYDFLASEFTICNKWFSSLPTDTWPNRLYSLTGGSGGLIQTPSGDDVVRNPPGFMLRTIFEVLEERQVDWVNFYSNLPYALIFRRLAQDARYTARMRLLDEFFSRAATGDLPSVSWLDPSFSDVRFDPNVNDNHPPGDIIPGQHLVERIYTALASSPAWSKTVLIITSDEHGGFYDHVNPPQGAQVPDDNPNFQAYGVRVPTFIISPWVKPKTASGVTFDHTSLISTILRRFCLNPNGSVPSMGKRADHANTIAPLLSATAPRPGPSCPQAPPPGCQVRSQPSATSFGAVLRKTLLSF